MKSKIYKILSYAMVLWLLAACDATEPGFWPGNKLTDSEILSLASTNSALTFNSDGGEQTISIKSRSTWTASVDKDDFSVSPASGEGDAILTIKANPNYNSNNREATLTIKSGEFERKMEFDITQTGLKFSMDGDVARTYSLKEYGDTVKLKFTSSAAWILRNTANTDANDAIGNPDWVKFERDSVGAGSNMQTEVSIIWKPNYGKASRKMTLELTPSDAQTATAVDHYKIEMTQEGGTLPRIINSQVSTVERNSVGFKFSYISNSPMKVAGVKVKNKNEELLNEIIISSDNDKILTEIPLEITIPNLEEGTKYSLIPYVENMVDLQEGDPVEVTTRTNPSISLLASGIVPDTKSVTVNYSIEKNNYEIHEITLHVYKDNEELNTKTTKNVDDRNITIDGLTPNTEYEVMVSMKTELEGDFQTARLPFSTLPMTPTASDNTTPDINNKN